VLETVEDEVKAYIYSGEDSSLTFESAILQAALYSTEDVNLPKKILQAMILKRVDLARTELELFANANVEKKVCGWLECPAFLIGGRLYTRR
jgi:hypothetical protein